MIFVKENLDGHRELRAWAKFLKLELPEGFEPKPELLTYIEACSIFREIGVLSNTPTLNTVQLAALAAFPDVETAFGEKLKEGYRLLSFKYESNEQTGHESLVIVFRKGYVQFELSQGKGHYAGGYSRAVFRREGERGEML